MEKLRFLSTMTAAEFKEQQGIDRIDDFKNEKSGKVFFQWGNENGAIYAKYPIDPLKEQMVSEVETSTGETFFLLHNR